MTLQFFDLFKKGQNNDLAHVKRLITVDDKFASTPNLTHTRLYKQYARSILTGGVWDNIPNWVDNDKQGIIFFEFFFWWVFGGASYVNALPLAQRQKCKNVPKGESGTNLGWMVTETKVYARDYPVDFPGGKRAPAVLQIHETSDEIMKRSQLKTRSC